MSVVGFVGARGYPPAWYERGATSRMTQRPPRLNPRQRSLPGRWRTVVDRGIRRLAGSGGRLLLSPSARFLAEESRNIPIKKRGQIKCNPKFLKRQIR